METPQTEHAGACSWVIAPAPDSAQPPYQLTFLSPFPDSEANDDEVTCVEGEHNQGGRKRSRRRVCRTVRSEDIASFDGSSLSRPLLRTSAGAFLPALYARTSLPDCAGDVADQAEAFIPADPSTIIESATALLRHRLRRGAKILCDPALLLLSCSCASYPSRALSSPSSSWTAISDSFDLPSSSTARTRRYRSVRRKWFAKYLHATQSRYSACAATRRETINQRRLT
jgi:hypothetical protein